MKRDGCVDLGRICDLNRREFLQAVAAGLVMLGWPRYGGAQTQDGWNQGRLKHLIPAASHERFLVKASFDAPLTGTPRLAVNGKPIEGERTDAQGRFWRFDASSLRPATTYELRLADSDGAPLCDAWPLKTFPAPDAAPERMRILALSCAGGYDAPPVEGKTTYLDMTARRRLLARGMSFRPDAVIANGDHIYWDMKTSLNKPFAKYVKERIWTKFGGALDLSVPMLHPRNAAIFTAVCDYQIPGLYGTTLRSSPAFFLTDDHDMFENDEFDAAVATLPPDSYGVIAAEQTRHLYYPEFLPDPHRPAWLPGGDKAGAPSGTNLHFGTLRFGKLLEAVLYDCRGFVDYKGAHARILPGWVEDWLVARTKAEDTAHFLHAPSLPFGFSSGKLGDWYPDLLDEKTGRRVLHKAKEGWQPGWFAQHQRLIEPLSAQTGRAAIIVQGDFHVSAAGKIVRSGELTLARPVHVVMTGALGTGDRTFPSAFRRVESLPSQLVGMEQALKPTEKNGFTVIDVTPEKVTFSMFLWRPPQPVEEIDTMKPALVYEVPRGA